MTPRWTATARSCYAARVFAAPRACALPASWSRWSPLAAPLVATLLGALPACDPGRHDPDAALPDADLIPPSCREAEAHSDLAWLEQNLFLPNCSRSRSCHQGTAQQAGGLNLEPGNVHTNTVNVTSGLFDQFSLVVPGDPAASYLMIITDPLSADNPGGFAGPIDETVGSMPKNNPLLCSQKRDAIERWIMGGALPN